MEILGLVGFVFAATAIGALVYERRADVLHGPYIEGREQPQTPEWLLALSEMLDPVFDLAERLSFRARHAVYLASLA
jgi:hypothetical protein